MATCAGVQNVSRPMVRCQEMSQRIPIAMNAPPTSTAQTAFGTVAAPGEWTSGVTVVATATIRIDHKCTHKSNAAITKLDQTDRFSAPCGHVHANLSSALAGYPRNWRR